VKRRFPQRFYGARSGILEDLKFSKLVFASLSPIIADGLRPTSFVIKPARPLAKVHEPGLDYEKENGICLRQMLSFFGHERMPL
jgi:hypothetical protein